MTNHGRQPRLHLFTVFHLNMMYSSIEEEQRQEVIRRCYWPLLEVAESHGLPLGIEASALTLEIIQGISPAWIDKLKHLTAAGLCEFIGSGYSQIIGPLVPAEVNKANLSLGNQVYERLLGFRPRIAFVNEQAYSAGILQHYLEAHYQAIIMDWNNPARYHPEWQPDWRYWPQMACGQHGERLPLVWNNSIAFQKFQRYAHGELELEEFWEYLKGQLGSEPRVFPLYGNDAEIFDFRPGRYDTEGQVHPEGEWARIFRLLEVLRQDDHFVLTRPSQTLEWLSYPPASNPLQLESPEQPIVLKKQEKYNVTRWALTGRDNLGINTACWRVFRALQANRCDDADHWRRLCYLWSSDFRTHITAARWRTYQQELEAALQALGLSAADPPRTPTEAKRRTDEPFPRPAGVIASSPAGSSSLRCRAERQGRFIIVDTDTVKLRLNCRRGLAIDALWFKGESAEPFLGTLPHGYYEDISLGADFYSGHTIIEIPGNRRITDLNPADPEVRPGESEADPVLRLSALLTMAPGSVRKTFTVYLQQPRIDLDYVLAWPESLHGTLRTGIFTFVPTAFARDSLFYATHNGGYRPETFPLAGRMVAHDDPASVLVSARQGLGATRGWLAIGDARHVLQFCFDPAQVAAMPMIHYQEVQDRFFLRLLFSLGEIDETHHLRRDTAAASPYGHRSLAPGELNLHLSVRLAAGGSQAGRTMQVD